MKVFIVGDHRTGTGPANVTKKYIENFPASEKVIYQKMVSKAARVPELIIKTALCDVVLFSGYSKQNLLGLKLARIFKKPAAYLCHGCVEYENEINGVPDEEMSRCERLTMAGCDRIFAVSERFSDWLKQRYPENADKTDFVTNGAELPDDMRRENSDPENSGQTDDTDAAVRIFSIGGGMPRKKIKYICDAVKILNDEGMVCALDVAGDVGLDSAIIDASPFVKNHGIAGREEIKRLFRESSLFIQNSCFETFGLAPIEALSSGCSVLLSEAVGAIDIIDGIAEHDIIKNYNDPSEIAEKTKYLLKNPNGKRLLLSIDFNRCSWKSRGEELCGKLQDLLKK